METKGQPVAQGPVQRDQLAHAAQGDGRRGKTNDDGATARTRRGQAQLFWILLLLLLLTTPWQTWHKLVEADVYNQSKLNAFVEGH